MAHAHTPTLSHAHTHTLSLTHTHTHPQSQWRVFHDCCGIANAVDGQPIEVEILKSHFYSQFQYCIWQRVVLSAFLFLC